MAKNKFLLLFILCCAVPLLLAYLVLNFGWFDRGVTSNGQWQTEEEFVLTPSSEQAHWRIAVLPAKQCTELCQNAIYTVQQLYIGLGRKQQQVQPVLVSTESLPVLPNSFSQQAAKQNISTELLNQIVLIDHQGLALLRYPMPSTEAEMVLTAKALRQDLLKLLNYDRTDV
ncbi:hypothetical protein [Rheinheimera salexigens]|uniref:Transmembrane cytochrome oxidase associated protein n=1 Tax=Rheinheimera salexigens TaxID=1628148 RepID=A0A1E7Q2C3_9GAMM|nr:hypothetical protein [Rheinheimera salexigens]OEY68218.1 hypothetical protein BI198_00535 [Rheinheimera salexigens]